MVLVRTTPPRPVEVTDLFPELAPLARPAIRLHPRPGSPSVKDSSVGGPLLWPVDEPWPHCEDAHLHGDSGFRESPAAIRLGRYRRAQRHDDPYGPLFTPEEVAALEQKAARLAERLDAGPPWPDEGPVPLLPVAQLYLRDVPLLRPPAEADLLQVLWCPYDHEPNWKPATRVFWRSAASVTDVLASPPEPYEANYDGYVPEPCVLAPEAITEYPCSLDLSPEVKQVVQDWSRWQAARAVVHGSYEEYPAEYYDAHLADAPGWKVGGWPPWGRTDPNPRYCAVCEARMVPLLTIASFEWDGETYNWAPQEERDAAYARGHLAGLNPAQPTRVEVGSTDNMQLYVCPDSPEHPHTDLIQ